MDVNKTNDLFKRFFRSDTCSYMTFILSDRYLYILLQYIRHWKNWATANNGNQEPTFCNQEPTTVLHNHQHRLTVTAFDNLYTIQPHLTIKTNTRQPTGAKIHQILYILRNTARNQYKPLLLCSPEDDNNASNFFQRPSDLFGYNLDLDNNNPTNFYFPFDNRYPTMSDDKFCVKYVILRRWLYPALFLSKNFKCMRPEKSMQGRGWGWHLPLV